MASAIGLVAGAALAALWFFSVSASPPAFVVVDRLADRMVPASVPLPSAAAYRWGRADIESQWRRLSADTGVLLKSPELRLDASGESDDFEAVAITLAPSRDRVMLLWNDSPTFARADFLRNRRELLPSPTQPARVLIRGEDIRAETRTPVRYLFLHLPSAARTADVVTTVEIYRRSGELAGGQPRRIRLTSEGRTRDAIYMPAGRSLQAAVQTPRDTELAVAVRGANEPFAGRARIIVDTADGETTLLDRAVSSAAWEDLRVPLPRAERATVRFEATGTAGAVFWGDPRIVREADDAAPNVILYVVDALRADRLGVYGAAPSRSPFLDDLARRSVVFDRAYATASWTKPSVTSLLTGLHPQTHMLGARLYTDPLPDAVPTLQDLLRERGYTTAQFSANPLSAALSNLDQGFDEAFGPDAFGPEGGRADPKRKIVSEWVNAQIFRWLGVHKRDRFFLYVQSMDPHGPLGEGPDPYGAAIARNDDALRDLYERLEDFGLDRRTLFIVTSDHGEAFGDHGRTGHGQSVYEEEIRVPLLMHWAEQARPLRGLLAPARIAEPISLIDVMPAILDLCDGKRPSSFGRRAPIFASSFVYPEDVDAQDPNRVQATAMIDFPWKLIVSGERAELYNLTADPGEKRNLAAADPARADTMRDRLRTFLSEQEAARRQFAIRYGPDAGERRAMTRDVLEQLKSLGYVR